MAQYNHGPDFSDSDDSLFEDDADYENYKQKLKNLRKEQEVVTLTEEQKLQQDLNQFFNAISCGNITHVLEFLDKGFDVNTDVRDKWTPILLAASYGNPDLTTLLLTKGADPNSDREATTALMMACSCPDYTSPFEKSFQTVKLLVEAGASVKATDRKRMNALMYAAFSGNTEAVKYLLSLSEKIALDNQRWSALTWAVSYNQLEIVKLLLENDFNINLVDVRGNTPIDIAREFNFEEILNLFPQDKEEIVLDIINNSKLEFEEHFDRLEKGQKPQFFLDICKILVSVKCDNLIPLFHEKSVTLDQFLAMSDSDLKAVGVLMPYQRHRILTGLHRLHKRPFHPKSIHICLDKKTYSNVDVAVQTLSAIRQIIAMESGLVFLRKCRQQGTFTKEENWQQGAFAKEENDTIKRNIANIETKLKFCKLIAENLTDRFKQWDKIVEPADLITKKSRKKQLPWKKIILSLGVLSMAVLIGLKNT